MAEQLAIIFSTLTLIFHFYGCQEKDYSQKDLVQYFTEEEELFNQYDAYFEVKFQTGLNTHDSVTMGRQAQANALFSRDGNGLLNAGEVSIGDHDFTIDQRTHQYQAAFTYNQLDEIFGHHAAYKVSGSDDFPGIQHQTYFPEILKASTPDIDQFSFIDRGSDLDLEWNEDPSNDNPVLVALYYDGTYNHGIHEDLPEDNFFKYYEVKDNGSFTVPSEELERFPKGSHGTVYMLRGHHQKMELNEELDAGFLALSKVEGSFIMEEEIEDDQPF